MGVLRSPFSDEIYDTWLLPNRILMQSVNVDQSLEQISYYVGIVQLLQGTGTLDTSAFIPEWWGDRMVAIEKTLLDELGKLWKD